jgi:hypothetical protein
MLHRQVVKASGIVLMSVIMSVSLSGCGEPDKMPTSKVDIFVLDLSGSNDKASQLSRLNEDFEDSLTNDPLGVPKQTANKTIAGPVTTLFTFIEDVALKAPTFKIQDAKSTVNLWNTEFADDTNRNARSWEETSSIYDNYLRKSLGDGLDFNTPKCVKDLDSQLESLFNSDFKRNLIVTPLCQKIAGVVSGYTEMIKYVQTTKAPATDVFGALAKLDRLINQFHKDEPDAKITLNIASDMLHSTGDNRDISERLAAANYEGAQVCEMAKIDREQNGFNFDELAIVKVNGIGNAKRITAQKGSALLKYWECFFNSSAEIR